ncbi:MAG: tRNA-intron lyase [Nanoarchaeota archaeon]
MITLHLSGQKIFSNSEEAFSLREKSSFGEKKAGKVEYSDFEALYILENGKANLLSGKKQLSFDDLTEKLMKRDKKLETKYAVYRDLRKKGYILKTALKFGAEFRVYDRGVKPGESHSSWLLHTVQESDKFNWHEFAAKNRVAHSTKKKLLIGIVDSESSVSYYEISWKKT